LVNQWAYLGLRPLTISKNALWIFSVIGPRAHVIVLAQWDTVEFADWRDFGGGTGKERFVGDVHLITRDALLYDFNA
jgi:hypothetical protein